MPETETPGAHMIRAGVFRNRSEEVRDALVRGATLREHIDGTIIDSEAGTTQHDDADKFISLPV